jgi:hypothetical protein
MLNVSQLPIVCISVAAGKNKRSSVNQVLKKSSKTFFCSAVTLMADDASSILKSLALLPSCAIPVRYSSQNTDGVWGLFCL